MKMRIKTTVAAAAAFAALACAVAQAQPDTQKAAQDARASVAASKALAEVSEKPEFVIGAMKASVYDSMDGVFISIDESGFSSSANKPRHSILVTARVAGELVNDSQQAVMTVVGRGVRVQKTYWVTDLDDTVAFWIDQTMACDPMTVTISLKDYPEISVKRVLNFSCGE